MNARERFRCWREALGHNRREMGELLECDGSYVAHIEHARRFPGRKLANIIEARSAEWAEGPIRATEWDELEATETASKEAS